MTKYKVKEIIYWEVEAENKDEAVDKCQNCEGKFLYCKYGVKKL